MSSQAQQSEVQATSDNITEGDIFIAALALLSYDTLLNFSQEVEYIWNKRIKLGTVLYLMARYMMLLYLLLEVTGGSLLSPSLQTCNAIFHSVDTIRILPIAGIQGLLFARAYAVADHKRVVVAVLGTLGCCIILPELAEAVLDKCDVSSSVNNAITKLNYVITLAVILSDTVVVSVTLASTLGTWRVYRPSTWHKLSLTHLLAQQSLLRFGFVLTMTLADSILPFILRPTIGSVLGPMQNSLSGILICRFHIDLQRQNAHPNNTTAQDLPTIGSFHVATQRIHNAIMDEFGDLHTEAPLGTETSREVVLHEDPDLPGVMTQDDIDLVATQSQSHAV